MIRPRLSTRHWGVAAETKCLRFGLGGLTSSPICRFGSCMTLGSYRATMTEVKLKKGEPVEKAIRRLKKKLDREQTLQQFRLHRRFEKPSAKKRRKEKAARFSAMLKARYADD